MDEGEPITGAEEVPAVLTDEAPVDGQVEGDVGQGVDTPQRSCRICYAERYDSRADDGVDGAEGELLTPCRCVGSQRYVHRACLRRWQETVLLSGPPLHSTDESRHSLCSVCLSPFTLSPPSRERMFRAFVGETVYSQLRPGSLLIRTPTVPMPDLESSVPEVLLTLFRLKRAHMVDAVYLVYEAQAGEDSDSEAVVKAVNLTRNMATEQYEPRVERRGYELLLAREGVRASIALYNGGPVGWSNVRVAASPVALSREVPDDVNSLRLLADDRQILLDSVPQLGKHVAPVEGGQEVRIFCGYGRWGWVQLLGEIARGDWGVCPASLDDVFAAEPKQLWTRIRNERAVSYPCSTSPTGSNAVT